MTGTAARLRREVRRIARDVVVNGMFATAVVPDRLRWRLLRAAGYDVSPCRVAPGVFVGSGPLSIGVGSMVNREVFLDPSAGIRIGSAVTIGMRSMFITASHTIGPTESLRTDRSPGTEVLAPIRVHDHVWVGAGATILPGVVIESGCVIAAGSVVTRDCTANGLYAGVPAKRVRDLPV